ncbi:MAG TPA: U32 family peptidase C-terminal domain-containing protein [Patescibacteria group bacterium]|nr:U32 family peptidase C-terminal domain-containing protein [Patescibacteria group bacterium]
MKKTNKIPELLAPAGDLEKLKYAFDYGADAVYLGLPAYSLRAQTGFDMKSIGVGIKYAHKLDKKVYVTINIFAHNRHIKELPTYLRQLKKLNPDAVILSDLGVLMLIKKYLPKVKIHLSTQANTLNSEAVKFWHKQGVSRIILGREVSLKDIKEIHQTVPKMELEVFVHGAMCMSYSGRCYLSAWLNSRSANLGLCTQPCRWEYKIFLEEGLRPGQMIPIEADDKGTYIMNSKDLCLIDYLDELKKAGVMSFKIEGRTKSIYYLATVVKAYRQAFQRITQNTKHKTHNKDLKLELDKIDNRGYTTGFLLGNEVGRQEFKTSKAMSDWEFVGEIVKIDNYSLAVIPRERSDREDPVESENFLQTIFIKVHNVLKPGDEVEIMTPSENYKVKIKELINEKGDKVKSAHGGTKEIFKIEIPVQYDIVEKSLIRKKK